MALPWALRRILMPVWVAIELAVLALLLPVAVVGLLSGLVDRRLRLLRLAAMGMAYILVELSTLAVLLGVWAMRPLRGRAWWDRTNVSVVAWALGHVLGAARRTVGFRISLQEPPPGSASLALLGGTDPVLVLARHGGIGDSFSLAWLLAARYHRRPRIVLKSLLLWEPMIDVALTRMKACFLPPAARRGEALEGRVGALGASLVPGEALLLFPEGGNWTPRRRLRAIARLWASGKPSAVRAASLMSHVLPPRAGGVLACLDSCPDLPVVVVAHTGLDRITSAGDLWRELPFDPAMSVRWWLASPAPSGEEERLAWLTAEWAVVDEWIDAQRQDGSAPVAETSTSSRKRA